MIADLCLVLLLDASGSVDAAEWELQARATAEALSSPAIVEQILRGPQGRIAVTAMEWSGSALTILPWTVIASLGEAQSVALALQTYQRLQSGSTAVGDALMASAAAIKASPVRCARSVVDLSSDGTSNAGSDPGAAVAFLRQMDVQVNAIVIQDEIGVVEFYERTVSGFVLPADWPAYAQAIRAKLSLEIAGHSVGPLSARSVAPSSALRAEGAPSIELRGPVFISPLVGMPWDLGWPSAPEAPQPFYPDLRQAESVPTHGVPGPGAALLLGLGLLGLFFARGRR